MQARRRKRDVQAQVCRTAHAGWYADWRTESVGQRQEERFVVDVAGDGEHLQQDRDGIEGKVEHKDSADDDGAEAAARADKVVDFCPAKNRENSVSCVGRLGSEAPRCAHQKKRIAVKVEKKRVAGSEPRMVIAVSFGVATPNLLRA